MLECEQAPQGFAVVLDRTVLFPEGGGQLSDTGTINGAAVKHVRETKGKIIHECAAEFPVGSKVTVQVNWTDRLDHMQQHCGEHILSYAFFKLFGRWRKPFRQKIWLTGISGKTVRLRFLICLIPK